VVDVVQEPDPLQTLAGVPTPFVQVPGVHSTVSSAYVHVAAVFPSQVALHVPVPAHVERDPRGVPVTIVHVPAVFCSLQDSHWPGQSELQHTPSAQCPLVH
jgi:hypothetical protein